MRGPRLLLLTAAAALAVVHVIGVLFARPLFRPAELLATLCLLACAIGYDRTRGSWGLSIATAALVAGAALTVPTAAPGEVPGLQILSPEQYEGLVREAQLESLAAVTAALLFVLALLAAAMLRRRAQSRAAVGLGIAAALLVIGYVVLRCVVIVSGAPRESLETSLGVAVLMPLLLAVAALALTVMTATHRQWRAAAGALLFVALAMIWTDAAIGAVDLPYEVREYAQVFSLNLIEPTDTLPQPTRALTAALQLAGAVLATAGLTRRTPAS